MIKYAVLLIVKMTIFEKWNTLKNNLDETYKDYCKSVKPCLSQVLIESLIVAEDFRFYRHNGVDTLSIVRVIRKYIFSGIIEGASTIEQQLVRTLSGNYERRLSRKLKEMLFAMLVKNIIPKSDIPGVYLSVAYFGWRMNGIMQACSKLHYLPDAITTYQAAQLISRLKYPEPRIIPLERAKQINMRTQYIIRRLAEKKSIYEVSEEVLRKGLNDEII